MSNCPIDAWPRNAFDFFVSGKDDVAAFGRSIGIFVLNPNLRTPASIWLWPITSAPIVAKAELHDTRRMSNRAPPHDSPPKFEMG